MIASMVFGLLGCLFMVGFVEGFTASMLENAIRDQTAHLQIHHPDFLLNEDLAAWIPDAEELAEKIRRTDGVQGVAVRQVVDGMMASAASSRGVRINGVDAEHEALVTGVADRIVEGGGLTDDARRPILISRRSARRLNLRVGSKLVATFSDLHGEVTGAAFRISGLFETPASGFDETNLFVRRNDLADLTQLTQANEIVIRLRDGSQLDAISPRVRELIGGGAVLRDWGEIQPVLKAMLGSMATSNRILISIFVLALGFGIVNAMLMSVFERTREFGVLRAVGMTRPRVLALIVLESTFLGGIGGGLGVLVSAAAVAVVGRLGLPLGAMAEGLGSFGADAVLYPSVPAATYAMVLALVGVISVFAALYPARHTLKKRTSEMLAERH